MIIPVDNPYLRNLGNLNVILKNFQTWYAPSVRCIDNHQKDRNAFDYLTVCVISVSLGGVRGFYINSDANANADADADANSNANANANANTNTNAKIDMMLIWC